MQTQIEQIKSFEKKEFAFVHVLERRLSVFWQEFFETQLNIKGVDRYKFEDCYQFHGFIIKKNSWRMYQRRFMVLTMKWMFNVEADFDKKTKQVKFTSAQW